MPRADLVNLFDALPDFYFCFNLGGSPQNRVQCRKLIDDANLAFSWVFVLSKHALQSLAQFAQCHENGSEGGFTVASFRRQKCCVLFPSHGKETNASTLHQVEAVLTPMSNDTEVPW